MKFTRASVLALVAAVATTASFAHADTVGFTFGVFGANNATSTTLGTFGTGSAISYGSADNNQQVVATFDDALGLASHPSLKLSFSPNGNTPLLGLKNTSSSAQITGMTFSMPYGSYVFDFAINEQSFGSAIGFSQLSPSLPDNNETTNPPTIAAKDISYNFTNFDAGSVFALQTDIDPGSFNFRNILFNNGAANPNAKVTVSFSNGQVLSATFDELHASYNGGGLGYVVSASAVPLPSVAWLGLGLLGIVGTSKLVRRRASLASA